MKREGKVMILIVMTNSIIVHGARGYSEPQTKHNMLPGRLSWSVICPDAWVGLFCFSNKSPCTVQLRQPCDHCRNHWCKLRQNCRMTHDKKSMVATWSRWLPVPSLPLTMKYASCAQYIIRHGRQDAKVKFDGYAAALQKSIEQASRTSKKISESILMDRNVPTTSQVDFLSNMSRPTSKTRCCFHDIFCARCLGCTDCCGKWHRLAGGTNYQGPRGCSTLHAPLSSTNITVFDITKLLNSVGECKGSMLSLHSVTGCDTSSVLYNQWKKNKTCKFSKNIQVLQ